MAKKKGSQLEGFVDFVRQQGVVGLAVGFILGGAVSGTVDSLVENIINPVLGWILGGVNFAEKTTTLVEKTATADAVVLSWGLVIEAIINLLVIAAVVYFGVKGLGLDKLDSKDDK